MMINLCQVSEEKVALASYYEGSTYMPFDAQPLYGIDPTSSFAPKISRVD